MQANLFHSPKFQVNFNQVVPNPNLMAANPALQNLAQYSFPVSPQLPGRVSMDSSNRNMYENVNSATKIVDGNHTQNTTPVPQTQQYVSPARATQILGFDPMEKVKNLNTLVQECQALAGNEVQPNSKILDVEMFTKIYQQLKSDLEKIAKENQKLTKVADAKKVEAEDAVSRLKRMESKTFEWIKLEREFAEVFPKMDHIQRRYGDLLSRYQNCNEDFYEKSNEYFRKLLNYEERIYLNQRDLVKMSQLEKENFDLRYGGVKGGEETTDSEEINTIGATTNTAVMTILSILNTFYNENDALLKTNDILYGNFTDLIIMLNDENFLARLNDKPPQSAKRSNSGFKKEKSCSGKSTQLQQESSDQLQRLHAILTEINNSTVAFEKMFDNFRQLKQENTTCISSFSEFTKNLQTTLDNSKIAHEIEAERLKEAHSQIRELTGRLEYAENMGKKLTDERDDLIRKMNEFARETHHSHEKQLTQLRETYETSIQDLMNLNNTVQENLAKTKNERDHYEAKSSDVERNFEAASQVCEDLKVKLNTKESEKCNLEARIATLLEHNKGLLERLQNLNNENMVLHNTIVSLNTMGERENIGPAVNARYHM
eukprot:TRINITY_DN140_c0_g1_i1.p1 TRINITY_DN140_c0_g1~~TRINITY_DN140_c0_g1_i1.p1  ORF type:complete len:602 (-),score=190.49 TRINITY_DN140_c0_g1_i1:110-1915(-)